MIQQILKWLIGGNSKRYRFMIIYAVIFIVLTLSGKLDAMAFATFTTAFCAWLGVDTLKKGKD